MLKTKLVIFVVPINSKNYQVVKIICLNEIDCKTFHISIKYIFCTPKIVNYNFIIKKVYLNALNHIKFILDFNFILFMIFFISILIIYFKVV